MKTRKATERMASQDKNFVFDALLDLGGGNSTPSGSKIGRFSGSILMAAGRVGEVGRVR